MGGEAKVTKRRLASLTAEEHEFISEMEHEPGTEWANFDPPFLRRFVSRLERWGWLETEGHDRDAQHRWTSAGRRALTPKPPNTGGRT